ncbi:MAG: hypothetical protein V1847_00175 [Candidatus Diapherotrites archaeon]
MKGSIFCATSARLKKYNSTIQQFVLENDWNPITSEHASSDVVNELVEKCDELWVFGEVDVSVKQQMLQARQRGKPVKFFEIEQRFGKPFFSESKQWR